MAVTLLLSSGFKRAEAISIRQMPPPNPPEGLGVRWEVFSGKYFRVTHPQDWQVQEYPHGISVTAPDRSAGFEWVTVAMQGHQTAPGFIDYMHSLKLSQAETLREQRPYAWQGPWGILWQVSAREYTGVMKENGWRIRATTTAYVYNQTAVNYIAFSTTCLAREESYESIAPVLKFISESVRPDGEYAKNQFPVLK